MISIIITNKVPREYLNFPEQEDRYRIVLDGNKKEIRRIRKLIKEENQRPEKE